MLARVEMRRRPVRPGRQHDLERDPFSARCLGGLDQREDTVWELEWLVHVYPRRYFATASGNATAMIASAQISARVT